MSRLHVASIVLLLLLPCGLTAARLSPTYYSKTCPQLQAVVAAAVKTEVAGDVTTAPKLLRLLFHDCFVQGCDASIMVLYPPTEDLPEMAAPNNVNIGGLDFINALKAAVEKVCPQTVSCADLIVLAAQQAVVQVGGPSVPMKLGRLDSLTTSFQDTFTIPTPNLNYTDLKASFAARGLSELDLVALSGAHTIGQSSCSAFQNRLTPPDNTMKTPYRHSLLGQCGGRQNFNGSIKVYNDPTTPQVFDNEYYKNIRGKKGLFKTDQELYFQKYTSHAVVSFAKSQEQFFSHFMRSLVRMSEIGVLTGSSGEVRKDCNFLNAQL